MNAAFIEELPFSGNSVRRKGRSCRTCVEKSNPCFEKSNFAMIIPSFDCIGEGARKMNPWSSSDGLIAA
jgi:hypothetical protein